MRRLVLIIAVLSIFAVGSSPAYATAKYLSTVVPVKQAKSNWCWAASGEMVEKHFSGTLSQWANVDYIYPGENYPNKAASIYQTDQAIDHFQRVGENGNITLNPLSFTAVKYQTNENGPIVTFWAWYSGGGHVVVCRGYDDASPGYVYWVDPGDGYGHKNTFSWFDNDGSHDWIYSIFYK